MWISLAPRKKCVSWRGFFCETPIPKAKRIGIGKLNNPMSKANRDNETQASEAKCIEACLSNYPRSAATQDLRLSENKRSASQLLFHNKHYSRQPINIYTRLHILQPIYFLLDILYLRLYKESTTIHDTLDLVKHYFIPLNFFFVKYNI